MIRYYGQSRNIQSLPLQVSEYGGAGDSEAGVHHPAGGRLLVNSPELHILGTVSRGHRLDPAPAVGGTARHSPGVPYTLSDIQYTTLRIYNSH